VTPNEAMRLLSRATGDDFEPFDGWWGDVPMPILAAVFRSPDPAAMLRLFGFDEQAKAFKPSDPEQLIKQAASKVDAINQSADVASGRTGEPDGVTNG
jgi:hypothetical protein